MGFLKCKTEKIKACGKKGKNKRFKRGKYTVKVIEFFKLSALENNCR